MVSSFAAFAYYPMQYFKVSTGLDSFVIPGQTNDNQYPGALVHIFPLREMNWAWISETCRFLF